MKLQILTILSQVILISLLLTVGRTRCEQPPTVFVLDTSDSESSSSGGIDSSSLKSAQDDSIKTEIITDESMIKEKQAANDEARTLDDQAKQITNQRHKQTTIDGSETGHQHQVSKIDGKQHPHPHHQDPMKEKQDPGHNAESHSRHHSHVINRSLDTESHPPAHDKPDHNAPHSHQTNQHNNSVGQHSEPSPHIHGQPPHHNGPHHQPAHNPQNQNHKPKASPAPLAHAHNPEQVPKTEERLLISIITDEDDPYQKPAKQVGSSTGVNEEMTSHQQQPHHHNKRKPGFTISIQDPSTLNKQNGGASAVIVRPTEDGIVISTVNSNNNKKPSNGGGLLSGLLSSVSETINQAPAINGPYREPVNSPIRPTSTTRSPNLDDQYNNQPVTSSTLVGGQRPQQPWTDERPQKPTFDESTISETTKRPTSRPNYQDTSSQQQDYEPNNNEQAGPKYPLNEKNCGIMHETRIVGGEEADPDDFMWMAAIIKSKPRDGEPRPFCGGSLITRRHILTAAHCLEGLAPRDVLVRLGGYDFEDTASSSSADFAIDQFRVPAQYSKKTHVADIAIMRLKTPLQPTDNYKTVCMPQPRRSYVGALGTVTGYGSQSQTFRRAAPKLRQVTVPIWENRKCSTVYKKNLTESFMCAGYEEGGKDACQGDSGGPLMTEGPEQKMMIVGVVSHGIGCGAPGYPGVYTRTSTFTEWIEKNTRE